MIKVFAWIVLTVAIAIPASAAETGFIQVKCDSGIKIFLDGNLKGIASADVGGVIIQDVSVGDHIIKVKKSGFQPQVYSIKVKSYEVAFWQVKLFTPKIRITQDGSGNMAELEYNVGELLIRSLPIECDLSISALDLNNLSKAKDRWGAEGVPVGTYSLTARTMGKSMHHKVVVRRNRTTELFINFISGEIKDLREIRHAQARMADKEREKKWSPYVL